MTTTEFLTARPRVKPDVVLGSAQRRGPTQFHLVKHLDSGRSFEVGAKEHFIISRLDGKRTLAEISDDYSRQFQRGLGAANWGQILGALHQRDLLVGASAAAVPAPTGHSAKRGRHRRATRHLLGGTVRLVGDASAVVDRTHERLRFAFSPWFVVPALLLAVFMEVVLVRDLGDLLRDASHLMHDPASTFLVLVAVWVGTALHELAHGVTARRHGVPVVEIGVRWLLPLVVLYCRVDNYLFLKKRWPQVAIAGSGVFVQLVLLLPAFAARWFLAPDGPVGDVLSALLLAGSALALANLVPLPPLDGYKMLSHSIGMADYARHSALFAVTAMRRRGAGVRMYPPGARLAYTAYLLGTTALVVAVAGGLVILGHHWLDSWLWPALAVGGLILLPAVGFLAALYGTASRASRSADRRAPAHAAVRTVAASSWRQEATARPAIELDWVRKRYGRRRAVDGVTLQVQPGEFLGLLGPNGAGKTTLIEIAVGLRRADDGMVSVLGMSPWPRNVALLPRIGVQTQSAAFFVRLSAREHLRTVAALYHLGPDAAERALRLVGLEDLAEVRADKLSIGQRQRLAIAAALVHDPELIFLDEPTAALDPQARRALWSVLRELHVAGRTIVYTTHHLDEAEALCDRVAIMSRGSILALDSPQRLIESAGLPTRLAVPRDRLSVEQASAMAGVTGVATEGGAVVIETHDSTAVLTQLGSMTGLQGVQTRSATLEDVYLELIGTEQVS